MSSHAAGAAGIDCSRARLPTEKAICASPALLSLDRSIADAYADKLSRQPGQADQARQELLAWLKRRDAVCNVPAASINQCLTTQLTDRLAALAPAMAAAPAIAPTPTAPVPATPGAAGAPSAEPSAAPPAAQPLREPAIPAAANPPQPAASLDAASLPAAEQASTLLHVTSPGRFTIRATSPGGSALQVVDMLTGPTAIAGAPGSQDGRLDALLDVGTYKVRVFAAKGATGAVGLGVTPFVDAAAPRALPRPGVPLDGELRDGQQRAFWLLVPPPGAVRIEAAGRALADLRLWRDGRDLVALGPDANQADASPGHPLNDLRLVGKVEPGTYLAVAYGGEALRWTDNDASQPFHLRAGASAALDEGWAFGTIGPFGSEVFALPASAQQVRLDVPAPEAVTLSAVGASVGIARNSREASATLPIPSTRPDVIELSGKAGQPYKLQALAIPPTMSVTRPGTYWVSAVTSGAGADEVPPSVLLERTELRTAAGPQPPRIVGSVMPVLSPSAGWRGQFNLRGPTTLLFQNASGGPVAVRTSGVSATGVRGRVTDLPADVYALDLTPAPGVQGVVDLIIGPPGLNPALVAPLPANPVLPLGIQEIGPGQSLQLSALGAPGVAVGLSARRVPVALAEGALSATMVAGSTLTVPVQVASGGTLAVSEGGGGPVAYTMQGGSVVIAAADRPRTVVLAWRRTVRPVADIPPPPPLASVAGLQAGRPAFLDLAADAPRGFSLTVPEGGLFRVETTGRLHTKGRLATPFIPTLGAGDGNGAGQNMSIQSLLRAGRYRVDVTAVGSSGHLGVVATPAPVLGGAALLPGGSVRATLPAGTGVRFPIEVGGQAERYHLEVASLGAAWSGRVDDAEGWPVTAPGPLDGQDLALRPGRYSMLVIPDDVTRQVVARLTPLSTPPEIGGHGPHPLAFGTPAQSVWREPDGRDQPRIPDIWTFGLDGPADVALVLGDGMVGDLWREGTADPVAHVTRRYDGQLEAGRYRLEVSSLGRNDRLAYTVALSSKALQPGAMRRVTLPASVPFAIAEARVVGLTTFGTVPVKGVLRREDGGAVARLGPRADDWNVAASRPLPAGRYTLDLAAASPPDTTATSLRQRGPADDGDDAEDVDGDGQAAQTAATRSAVTADAPATPDAGQSGGGSGDEGPGPSVELRLSLPGALPAAAAPETLAALTGQGVHVLTLPQPEPGGLIVVQARSSATVVLTLERQERAGWRVVAIDQGAAPVVASPADADPAPWRVQAWAVDGGPEPIELAARTFDVAAQAPGTVSLGPLDAQVGGGLAAARVRLPAAGIAGLDAAPAGLLAGGWPGHALTPAEGGTVLPEGTDVWLLGHAAASMAVTPKALPAGEALALALPAGLTATLPATAPGTGHVALWRAASGLGVPGLGGSMGVAAGGGVAAGWGVAAGGATSGDTLALADGPVPLRNAAGDDALRLRLTRLEPLLLPARTVAAALQTVLPPGTALPLALPAGGKQVHLDLAAGVAAVVGWRGPGGSVVWTGAAPVSRSLAGAWTEVLLVNTGASAAPASLSWQPGPAAAPLRAASIVKRFFGADGSFETTAEAAPGARLMTAGNATLTVIAADGRVSTGHDVALAGPARVVVDTTAGAMAVWEAADGASPWPEAAAQPSPVPARLPMSGAAMALALTPGGPVLLHARTTAPVLIGLVQPGGAIAPELFPAGAEFHRLLAGAAELRLYSSHDGPLSGTLELSADPVTPIAEGLGAEVSVGPGNTAVFGFSLSKAATVGVGVRAVPDTVSVRLLDAGGMPVGDGVAQLRSLPAGRYALEARVPPGAPTTTLRPAVVGITPRGSGPPPDVAEGYLELVGMKPAGKTP